MRFKLLRFDSVVDVVPGVPSVLEVEDHALFARVTGSLISGLGEEAEEPYLLWDEAKGKAINPKKGMLVLHSLPELPYDDKKLLGKLYSHMQGLLEKDGEAQDAIAVLTEGLGARLEGIGCRLRGTYDFEVEWSVEHYLKAFAFEPVYDGCETFLERCISFFGLCSDIELAKTLVMVNAKSFFTPDEMRELYEQVFFLNIPLLLIEPSIDEHVYERERKRCIDLHFLES